MLESILDSTKKILGVDYSYTAFDTDIITHINAVFSVMNQLGVGPVNGFYISDSEAKWADLQVPDNQLNLIKTYVFLKVRVLFDPPQTGFLVTSMENQIKEYEWRLSTMREFTMPLNSDTPTEEVV